MAEFFLTRRCSRCGQKTKRKDEHGDPICFDCAMKLSIARTTKPLHCPIDGEELQKELWPGKGEYVADRCPACRGLWLSYEEVMALRKEPDGGGSTGGGGAG